MTSAPGVEVFASEGLRAVFRDAGAPARPLVVTFDSLNIDLRLDRAGFGQAWLAQQGYDAVHVVSSRNAWYQDPDVPALLDAVRAFAAGRARVVTYGSSMGGYAAVRFAGRVGAHAVAALSPQWSVDAAAAPWETRWTEYAGGLDFAVEAAVGSGPGPDQVFVVYDPSNRDRLHLEALARRYRVTPLPVRFGGHPAGTYLAEAGLLSQAVLDMIEGDLDPAALSRKVREARRRSASWHGAAAVRQPPRRAALALRLASEATRLAPLTPSYERIRGEQLLRTGDPAAAGAAFRRAWELAPDEPGGRLRLAEHLALHGGDPVEVAELARGLHAKGAVREWLFVRASDLLFAVGAFGAAREEAWAASKRLPRSRRLRGRAWALGAALALPGLGPLVLEQLRRRLVDHRRGLEAAVDQDRLVGAAGFEPTTP